MLNSRQFELLVERVMKRIAEGPLDVYGKTSPALAAAAPTQFPGQDKDRPTIPATKSAAEKEMASDLQGKNTRNPKAAAPSQKTIKVNAIRKELQNLGYMNSADGAKRVTQALPGWYDQLDPGDALVSTAAELAQRFSQE